MSVVYIVSLMRKLLFFCVCFVSSDCLAICITSFLLYCLAGTVTMHFIRSKPQRSEILRSQCQGLIVQERRCSRVIPQVVLHVESCGTACHT